MLQLLNEGFALPETGESMGVQADGLDKKNG